MKTAPRRGRIAGRGQMLVIFALSIFVLMGIVAIVIDVSWYWTNSLRVQRAADAAALAGVVYLPGDVLKAVSTAKDEATKNGYTIPVGGCLAGTVCVTPVQDLPNTRRMKVTITAPVNTFFMKVFGINSLTATRTSKAEYVLPVPMGSPQNYYGVGLFIAAGAQTGFKSGTPVAGGAWVDPTRADGANNNQYATASSSGQAQQWNTFGLLSAPNAIPIGATIDGIEVQLDALRQGSGGNNDGCQILVALSWNGGVSWSPTNPDDMSITLDSGEDTFELGGSTNASAWTGHSWTRNEFLDATFRVRLTFNKASCGSGRTAAVDTLSVRISSNAGPRPIFDPFGGSVLAPQNFWGAMQSQGAPNIQGDAFMTKYETRQTSPKGPNDVDPAQDPDAVYDPTTYYNYGVDIPAGATSGEVWIFDPGFCAVASSQGTGESWTVGGSNGSSSPRPVSAYYQIFNTKGTPYDLLDDGAPIADTGTTFRRLNGSDSTLGGTNGSSSCTGSSWHNGWYRLATSVPMNGGALGTTYRVHTYSTDASAPADQDDTTALNSFAIWATAIGGTPRVYGNGAMEAYVRLPGGQASTFYLAQIEAAHAGKTMVIDLWDPGDTGVLSASLEIMQPTSGGYTPISFDYQATLGTSDDNASNCGAIAGTATSVATNTGGSSKLNGCWLRMTIKLPASYSAPTPPGETEPGWWKIRYTMGGSTNSFSTDLTTWKVAIRGQPGPPRRSVERPLTWAKPGRAARLRRVRTGLIPGDRPRSRARCWLPPAPSRRWTTLRCRARTGRLMPVAVRSSGPPGPATGAHAQRRARRRPCWCCGFGR